MLTEKKAYTILILCTGAPSEVGPDCGRGYLVLDRPSAAGDGRLLAPATSLRGVMNEDLHSLHSVQAAAYTCAFCA